jgi:cupin fold WbuC family metalloprotein
MKKFYSKSNPDLLLHIALSSEEVLSTGSRKDVVPEEQFLQLGIIKHDAGTKFRAHKHIFKKGFDTVIAQESWYVVQGSVKVIFYDVDDEVLDEVVLNKGDISITLQGGHNYEILEDNTIVCEYKTGPYEGQKLDKEFISD